MKTIVLLLVLLFLQGCAINQKLNGENVGRWVYKTKVEGKIREVVRGRYDHNGFQKGTWRYRYNGKLYKKQQFKDSIAYTTYYHPNGKIAEKGQTKLLSTPTGLHYFYFGSWFIYDTKEQLIYVRHYEFGQLQHETKVQR
ncbi:hypothetical protein [Myroides sp. DW712]|uniref:hypothetical protein n=1 Tax=Myroides sp. DW712 TaxID=3389800 RepID=UPI003978C7E6